ncbi:TetR/AcrR family transcriptional regulator [Pseudonocardia sp. HH130629-09]|uniref:TetR/AcrR family transcriptional regulator n=1 Tax=Pseudonocardia sp. HH130629-09 TaxID=1641402 RepID=UPI0006CB30CE|nr:TetR/AcrR family transcriptional regulator [Pseudonocardia sp. HH130629-09]ALE82228.1 hypothetical protein XF36_02975 [Pseudonocardia sp. HH130629-09]
MPPVRSRPPRADARRNRAAIVAAARQVFEAEGLRAPTDGIATAAGVGNATLYRNFPTRDDLLAAVVEDSMSDLLDTSADLDAAPAAADPLREWCFRLAWHLRTWHDLPTYVAAALNAPDSPLQAICARLGARTGELLDRARAEGSADPGVTAGALLELITATAWAVDHFGDDPAAARRRVALATAGVHTDRNRGPRRTSDPVHDGH